MAFIFSARIDGLVKREESPEDMMEGYVDRDDFMYYRQVTFGKRVKKFGPQEANARPIVVSCNQSICFVRPRSLNNFVFCVLALFMLGVWIKLHMEISFVERPRQERMPLLSDLYVPPPFLKCLIFLL